jgi:polyisoprenoid-binding protein YceI
VAEFCIVQLSIRYEKTIEQSFQKFFQTFNYFIMKKVSFYLALVMGMMIYAFVFHSISCTREDVVVGDIIPGNFEYSKDTVSSTNTKWEFDKSHSNVSWETPYKGVGSLLTGRFNTFNAHLDFIGDKPDQIKFNGFVVLSTVNTSEPGRDTGCLRTTFGLGIGTIADTAKLVSKSVVLDNKGGYIATCDMTFHGVTKEVKMQLNYSGKTYFPSAADYKKSYWVQGFTTQFEFKALSEYGLVTTNIADNVVVKMNILIRYYWAR